MVVKSLAAPTGQDVFVPAIAWIDGTLLGTLATIIAALAVAGVGLGMLSGRLDPRRGLAVIAGCFVLFGATGIAKGLRGTPNAVASDVVAAPRPAPIPHAHAAPKPIDADPYAGAAVRR